MAAIIWSDVVADAPELSAVAPAAQTVLLLYVNSVLDVAGYGGESHIRTRTARVMLAAHMATMFRRRGVPGFLSEQHAGPIGESFAMPPMAAMLNEFAMTSYGALFAMVTRGSAHRAGALV